MNESESSHGATWLEGEDSQGRTADEVANKQLGYEPITPSPRTSELLKEEPVVGVNPRKSTLDSVAMAASGARNVSEVPVAGSDTRTGVTGYRNTPETKKAWADRYSR